MNLQFTNNNGDASGAAPLSRAGRPRPAFFRRLQREPTQRLRKWQTCNTLKTMKTLTIRLPEPLASEIEAESRRRRVSKSDVVRERLQLLPKQRRAWPTPLHAIADLVGSVDGLPADLSSRKKEHLRATGYGQKRPR